MIRWVLLGLLLYYVGIGGSLATNASYVSSAEDNILLIKRIQEKKKKPKPKKHRHKKHKSKKHRSHKYKSKGKIYSAQKIQKLLENDQDEKVCNRLNCASNLEIAKSCLPTKASHRTEKKCFQAFCAYGCNEEDYNTKPDVHDFCNLKCSSKKYFNKGVGNN